MHFMRIISSYYLLRLTDIDLYRCSCAIDYYSSVSTPLCYLDFNTKHDSTEMY